MATLQVNGFTVGTELQTVILGINGGSIIPVEQIGHLKEFNLTQQQTKLTPIPVIYGGVPLHRNIYHGWEGRMTFTRYSGGLTFLMNEIAKNFQQNGYETYLTIAATVFNSTLNTFDEYVITQAVIDSNDAGTFSGTTEVDTSLMFRCQAIFNAGNGGYSYVVGGGQVIPIS